MPVDSGPRLVRGCDMIIGSGLIARGFAAHRFVPDNVCVYAAGVSNSACTDAREFERERLRLGAALQQCPDDALFVYFSTCSIGDPAAQTSAYVQHKIAMEQLIARRARYVVFRLPQLAGVTPNPHTLLNYLHARIVRSERFELWREASRNIIDVDDVVRIALDLIARENVCAETINIANTANSSALEIITAMEAATGHAAIFDIIERGAGYAIDTTRIQPCLQRLQLEFGGDYLQRTLSKYYRAHDSRPT